LRDGSFLDRATNLVVIGNPGTGKSHLLAGLGQELVRMGRTVLFSPTFQIVQRLLAAKRDLRLAAELKRLDRIEALVLDDLGYVQQSREEMEVLFTLVAERYERRSLLITTNLVFSKWDQIFKDPMTTAAAIDNRPPLGRHRTQHRELSGRRGQVADCFVKAGGEAIAVERNVQLLQLCEIGLPWGPSRCPPGPPGQALPENSRLTG
jgi:DNA replication protein DnaC